MSSEAGGSASDGTNSNDSSTSGSRVSPVDGVRMQALTQAPSEAEEEETVMDELADAEEQDMKPPMLSPEQPAASSPRHDHESDSGNTIMISAEDIAEAGLDMDNLDELSEEQVNMLMVIAERRTQQEMEAATASGDVDRDTSGEAQSQEQYGDTDEGVDESAQVPNNDAITMVITDDGSLKLTDASNQTFFFSTDQLDTMNVDVNNLTDESIQQIVHMAMPIINVGKGTERKPDITGEEHEPVIFGGEGMDVMQAGSSSGLKPVRSSQLMGEQVEIRRDGKPVNATIRYVRAGGSYKVQFDDGHFEWITDDQITLRGTRRTDHESYHNESTSAPPLPRVIHSSALPAALKRAAAGAVMRANAKRAHLEPNFCCPICENKVHQKEPAYIVIRIPACDACTREKIIVLDDAGDDEERPHIQ